MKIFRIIFVLSLFLFFINVGYAARTDFIRPAEVALAHDIVYTKEQLDHFAKTLPDLETLQWLKDNDYILIPGPPKPMSLLNVYNLNPELFVSRILKYALYAEEYKKSSREDTVRAVWLAIKKTPVSDFVSKSFYEQIKLLSEDERISSIAEIAWLATTYYKVRRLHLLSKIFVRTSFKLRSGARVIIGTGHAYALTVVSAFDDLRHKSLGLSAVREF